MMKGRKIRVDLPENEGREGDRGGRDGYRREGGGSRYGDRDGGRGEDREERSLAVSDWRNAPPAERDESKCCWNEPVNQVAGHWKQLTGAKMGLKTSP